MKIVWNPNHTPEELHTLLDTLAEEYPVHRGENASVRFVRDGADPEKLSVEKDSSGFVVTFGKLSAAARGIGYALAGREVSESLWFRSFGILLDCSRGPVFTVEHFKRWLRRLALLGYNTAMLYTKDAYQLPGEPYFGYMRGAYSLGEMREVDAYAKKLGIEMIASIQALGHVEPQLRWPAYSAVRDTDDVMLADDPKTYFLIRKMIAFWSIAFSSRRIHLGMDETQGLGRGRFLDLHGYENPFEIYNRHLAKVNDLCREFQLEPIIWSDMYFRFANKTMDYYDASAEVPEKVRAAIPKNVRLAYWDYYHRTEEMYEKRLSEQAKFNGTEPLMASGIWTWIRMWYDHEQTAATVAPCIEACVKTNTRDIVFTMWGDDGGYCEFDSAFAGMSWCADYADNAGKVDDSRVSALFSAVCGSDYALQIRAGEMEFPVRAEDGRAVAKVMAASVLWDDPLMGMVWHEYLHFSKSVWTDALAEYKKLLSELEPKREDRGAGWINHAWNIVNVLEKKTDFRLKLLKAYARRDLPTLRYLSEDSVPAVVEALEGLSDSFRAVWKRSFKPYGLEVIQIRLAGLAERYRETGRRIDELLDGECDRIEELEQNMETLGCPESRYRMIATAGWFI